MMSRQVLLSILALLASPILALAQTQNDFFDPNKLQEIRLEINPKDWNLLKQNFLSNTRYACDFHWKFNGKDVPIPEVAIRSRGFGSRSGVKPSLKVEFDYYDTKQTFLGIKTVVLRANTQDASMMHERLSMELMRRMGLPASRETHAKLFVNDEYVGLYTIVESIDKAFLRSRFNEDTGYLYSYQWAGAYRFEDRGADPAAYSPSPFEPEFNSQTPKPGPIASMVQAINQSPDSQFQSAVGRYLDMNSFLTLLAVESFLAEEDGIAGDYGLNNFYMYRFGGSDLNTFIPWDKSNTFFADGWPIMRNLDTNVLTRRALAIPENLAIFRAALARAADAAGGPGGWLEQEVMKEYLQIQQAAYADPNKQCAPNFEPALRNCTNIEFDQEVAGVLNFAHYRSLDVQGQLAGGTSEKTFSISDRGSFSVAAIEELSPARVGYARIQTDAGKTSPAGLAIFTLRNGKTVVSEAGVPASPLIQGGRLYAEVAGAVSTGLAIANPNPSGAAISFFFTNAAGVNFGQGTTTIPANGQIAAFLDSAPFNSGTLAGGTFTFTSSVPVAAIALRGLKNERNEFLMTTLPVIPVTPQTGNVVFPHFADGGGWTTQVILVNPTDQTQSGIVQFFSQGSASAPGLPLAMGTVESGTANIFNYSIPARAAFRLRTTAASANTSVGSVRVTPASGTSAPSGVAVFSFRQSNITVTEAGVPAVRTSSAFRLYVESAGDFAHARTGSIQTGVAVVNVNSGTADVTFELMSVDGISIGPSGVVSVPANGQVALYLNQVSAFSALPASFQGVLRISGPAGISVVGLRSRYNERGEYLVTTTPPVSESDAAPATELLFPHIVEGGGYTTQFVLFSSGAGAAPSGTLRFLTQGGQPLKLNIR